VYKSFLEENRFKKFKLKAEYRPLLKNLGSANNSPLSLPVQGTDFFTNPHTINILNFNYYNNDANLDSLDNNYENIKNFKYLYSFNNKNAQVQSLPSFTPVSYATVLDYFRADFDEHS
jgi:hypothetical protein